MRTIGEAVSYIEKLPKSEQSAAEWEDAMRALIVVIEGDGPAMFARMGIMRALNRHQPPKALPRMKRERPWMRRKPV
nr:hypothetical protein [Afipia massiliensis]